jgi:Fur family ferric uptake transcriptional regulator
MKADFTQILKQHDLSLTAVRLTVLDVLHKSPHTDANTIFTKVSKKIPQATIQAIYNNLNALTACGIIREIKPKGRASLYETKVCDNHHHMVCRQCGRVEDTHCKSHAPCLSPAEGHGFVLDEAEVIFWGLCPKCQ